LFKGEIRMSKLIPHIKNGKIELKETVKIGDSERRAAEARKAMLTKKYVAGSSRIKKNAKGCGGCSRRRKDKS